ncbi:MAG: EAL domain-containing protein [Rhodoferax sp.]
MPAPSRFQRLERAIAIGVYRFSTYALPLVIGALSLIALQYWPMRLLPLGPAPLPLQVLEDTTTSRDLDAMRPLLQAQPWVRHWDTQLSEQPVWLASTVGEDAAQRPTVIAFSSVHVRELACWDAANRRLLGWFAGSNFGGSLRAGMTGLALDLPAQGVALQLVCRLHPLVPNRISVALWSPENYQIATQNFERKSGILDGAMTVLCLLVLLFAAVNRSSLYLLFAVWLALNLRFAEISLGSDTQWLGHLLPLTWQESLRQATIASYYLATFALFGTIFDRDIKNTDARWLKRWARWSCVLVLACALLSPAAVFIPIVWACTAGTIVSIIYVFASSMAGRRSRAALWFGCSVLLVVLSALSELVSLPFGDALVTSNVNSITAAIVSSVTVAFAIAENLRQKSLRLAYLQAQTAQAVQAMPIGLFSLDLGGRFLNANPAMMQMLGTASPQDCGHWDSHFEAGSWTRLQKHLFLPPFDRRAGTGVVGLHRKPPGERRTVASDSDTEIEFLAKTGAYGDAPKRYLVHATRIQESVLGSMQDITEKSKALEELYYLANHDPLTRVMSRHGIEGVLASAMARVTSHRPLSLAYLDLDRFKLINDLYGHRTGDAVLQEVCARIQGCLPRQAAIGRVGGDEFVVVFPDLPVAAVSGICRRLMEVVGSQPFRLESSAFSVHCSIGLIDVDPKLPFKHAISTADRACQEAKDAQSGGLMVYPRNSPAYQSLGVRRELMTQFSGDTPFAGMHLAMQPVLSLNQPLESLNFEVLLRMQDTRASAVPTERLLAAAQASGHMGKIDLWVLRTTLAWLTSHRPTLAHTQCVYVNLSGASLNDEFFLQEAYGLFEKNAGAASMLCLEITEEVALQDIGNTCRFVDNVRTLGAKVALDDFGVGYTSFSQLKNIRADVLKIDGSLIVGINQQPADQAIVTSIVTLAKSLNMQVVAEWVEDLVTLQTLKDLGVDYAQGYVISPAVSPEKILHTGSSQEFLLAAA